MLARRRVSKMPLALMFYGVVVAATASVAIAASAGDFPLSELRETQLKQTVAVLEEGGPPLLARDSSGSAYFEQFANSQRYYAAPAGDDYGIYVYVPFLSRLFGTEDVARVQGLVAVALFAIPLALFPLFFWLLFRSLAAALMAPLGLLVALLTVIGFADIYWISAWAILTLVPPLLILARRWPRHGLLLLVLVMLGASFATSIRNHAGLPVAVAGLIVVLGRPWPWRRRAAAAGLVVVAYLAVSPVGMRAVEAYRDQRLRGSELGVTPTRSHVLWHPAYVGLGFLPNDYGIKWDDAIVLQHARRESPHVEYATPAYEEVVRRLFLRVLKQEPGEVALTTLKKGVAVVALAPGLLALAALGLWAMSLNERDRPLARRMLLLSAPGLVLGVVPPLIAIPTTEYAAGWIGALVLLSLLGLGWVAASTAHQDWMGFGARRAARLLARQAYASRGTRVTTAIAATTLVTALVAVAITPSVRSSCLDWQPKPPTDPAPPGWHTGCESSLYPRL
jgi:hypothetical protein